MELCIARTMKRGLLYKKKKKGAIGTGKIKGRSDHPDAAIRKSKGNRRGAV